jgi:chromosome segregation ATPase
MREHPYTKQDIAEAVERYRSRGDNYTAQMIETLHDRLVAVQSERDGASQRAEAHADSAGEMLRRIDDALGIKGHGPASVFVTIDAIKRLQDRLDVAESEAAGAIEASDEAGGDCAQLREELAQVRRNYALTLRTNAADVESYQAEIAQLRSQLAELEKDLREVTQLSEAQAGMPEILAEIDGARDLIETLRRMLDCSAFEVAEKVRELKAEQQRAASLAQHLEISEGTVATLESNYAAAREAADALEAEVVTLREQWQKAVDAERAQDGEVQRLTFRVRELEGTVGLLRGRITEIADMKVGSHELEKQALEWRATCAESNVAEVLDLRRDVIAQNASLLQKCTEQATELEELRARVGTWHDCKAQADAVDRANKRANAMTAELSAAKESLRVAWDRVKELEADLAACGVHRIRTFASQIAEEADKRVDASMTAARLSFEEYMGAAMVGRFIERLLMATIAELRDEIAYLERTLKAERSTAGWTTIF